MSFHSDVVRTPSVGDFNGMLRDGLEGKYIVDLEVKEFTDVTGREACDVFLFCYRVGERVDFLTVEDALRNKPGMISNENLN